MIGDELGADMHVIGCDAAAVRNLMLAIERCHLSIEAIVATPYAAGLSALVDDEAEIGVALVDMGGGTTTTGVFEGGHLDHVDAIAVGGNHVTMDIARGLTTRLADAERLKTLHGTAIVLGIRRARDDRPSPQVGEDAGARQSPAEVAARPHHQAARRGDPRTGARPARGRGLRGPCRPPRRADRRRQPADRCRRKSHAGLFRRQVRIGRPLGIQGLPESAKNPAFAAAVGLLVYPQVAGVEHFEPRGAAALQATGTDGYVTRVGRWLKESF